MSAASLIHRPTLILCLALAAACLGLATVSLTLGYVELGAAEVLRGVFGLADAPVALIVQELRLPRTLLALMIGAAMGASGAALQGLLLNPLAEPGVIGISASGGLGAVLALYFGWMSLSPYVLPASAMAGAGLATGALYLLAARNASTLTLILAGVAIGGLAISLTSLAMNLSPNPWAVSEIVFWLMGSVRDRTFEEVGLAAPFVLAGLALLVASGSALEAMSLGEEAARSLGVALGRARAQVILGVSLAVGATVAVAGVVGFVGLVVPHLLRPVVGHAPARLLIPSALGGAALILAADILVRLIAVGPELQLGVVTSLVGAPFFFWLIHRMKGRPG
ncbi:FecCD family ABC transporter permease [Albimonas pacifica]|uniref:Iron complex transport system permease protein n=1 Tax=Albimonas pacifica TaxID=1114924 RepID=A0A1I3FRT3_9RHOB|nr:iron ABC transporter permease [Albimonas pacifica]SFI13935.1 iron complex transport system permease protein [Albimonas pacifica]